MAGEKPTNQLTGMIAGWARFWLTPTSPVGLHTLRFLTGLLFLAWLLPFAGDPVAYFGLNGFFDLEAFRAATDVERIKTDLGEFAYRQEIMENPQIVPTPITWSVLYLCKTPGQIQAVYFAALAVFALFALGVAVRITAVLSWVLVASFISNPVIDYGADHLLLVLAFYFMIGYLLWGQWNGSPSWVDRIVGPWKASVLSRWFKRPADRDEQRPSYAANLVLRCIQVHFAIVIVVSALHKLQFGDWWTGFALWFSLHPPFETNPQQLLANAQDIQRNMLWVSLAAYLMLGWQLGFPLFAWKPSFRWLLLGGAVVGWIGCIYFYRLPLFGPIWVVVCLSYLTVAEWEWIRRWATLKFRD